MSKSALSARALYILANDEMMLGLAIRDLIFFHSEHNIMNLENDELSVSLLTYNLKKNKGNRGATDGVSMTKSNHGRGMLKRKEHQ